VKKRKQSLILENNGICQYCGKKFKATELDVHHIIEISKGGSNKDSNLIVLCPNDHRRAHVGTISREELKAIKNGKTSIQDTIDKKFPKTKKPLSIMEEMQKSSKELMSRFS
jgi:5-methylcytosine-specific restriction endonuclease McrA